MGFLWHKSKLVDLAGYRHRWLNPKKKKNTQKNYDGKEANGKLNSGKEIGLR